MKIKKLYATPDSGHDFYLGYWSVDNWVYFAVGGLFAHYHKPTVPYKPMKPLFHVQDMDVCPECKSFISQEMKDILVFLNEDNNNK